MDHQPVTTIPAGMQCCKKLLSVSDALPHLLLTESALSHAMHARLGPGRPLPTRLSRPSQIKVLSSPRSFSFRTFADLLLHLDHFCICRFKIKKMLLYTEEAASGGWRTIAGAFDVARPRAPPPFSSSPLQSLLAVLPLIQC